MLRVLENLTIVGNKVILLFISDIATMDVFERLGMHILLNPSP